MSTNQQIHSWIVEGDLAINGGDDIFWLHDPLDADTNLAPDIPITFEQLRDEIEMHNPTPVLIDTINVLPTHHMSGRAVARLLNFLIGRGYTFANQSQGDDIILNLGRTIN